MKIAESSDDVQDLRELLEARGRVVHMTAQYFSDATERFGLIARGSSGMHGFVFCTVDAGIATLELACACSGVAREEDTARLLIETAGKRLKTSPAVRAMRLLFLPNVRLCEYYKDMGFQGRLVGPPGSNVKLYEMLLDLRAHATTRGAADGRLPLAM